MYVKRNVNQSSQSVICNKYVISYLFVDCDYSPLFSSKRSSRDESARENWGEDKKSERERGGRRKESIYHLSFLDDLLGGKEGTIIAVYK